MTPEHPPPLPAQLRAARLTAGLALAQFAALAGFDGPGASVTAARWESGVRAPSVATLRTLARALSVTWTIGPK